MEQVYNEEVKHVLKKRKHIENIPESPRYGTEEPKSISEDKSKADDKAEDLHSSCYLNTDYVSEDQLTFLQFLEFLENV